MKLKELIWVGSTKKDLSSFSEDIQDDMGYGLYLAQIGEKHKNAKVLKGFGNASIIEMISLDESGTYRTVYTVAMSKAICILHVFQKKSKYGIETPKQDIDLIKSRLKQAQVVYKERFKV